MEFEASGRSRFNRPRRGSGRWVSLTKWLLFNVTALAGYEIPRTIRFIHRNSTRFWFKWSGGFCELGVDLCHRHCISINFHRAHVRIPIWPVILLQVDVKRASSPLEEKSQLTFTHSGLRGRTINRLLVSLYAILFFPPQLCGSLKGSGFRIPRVFIKWLKTLNENSRTSLVFLSPSRENTSGCWHFPPHLCENEILLYQLESSKESANFLNNDIRKDEFSSSIPYHLG